MMTGKTSRFSFRRDDKALKSTVLGLRDKRVREMYGEGEYELILPNNSLMSYVAMLKYDGACWNAIVPLCEGCISYGATRAEAVKNITEALELWLEDTV